MSRLIIYSPGSIKIMKRMDNTTRYGLIVLLAAALLQSACGAVGFAPSDPKPAARTAGSDAGPALNPAVSPFHTVLAAEYRALARKKRNMLDLIEYAHFRNKAAAAARDEKVAVDPAGSRTLGDADTARISTARTRLQNLPREVYTAFPRDAARAQAAFDCWFEEVADGHEGGDCETRLNGLLAQMECPGGCEEGPGGDVVKSYDVFFGLNSAALQPSAKAVILQASAFIQEHPGASVTVSGHTDRGGNAAYNEQLAQKRADAVASMLHERGVPRALITVETMGERAQAVVTDDDINLEGNRRVVISIIE